MTSVPPFSDTPVEYYSREDANRDIDALMEGSRKLVGEIDRSALGSFALPFEVLAIRHASSVLGDRGTFGDKTDLLQNILANRLTQACKTAGVDSSYAAFGKARTELRYWAQSNNGIPEDWADRYSVLDVEDEKKLHLVADNPAMLPYFESGIWDVDFIEDCLADNIDAAMAVSIYG